MSGTETKRPSNSSCHGVSKKWEKYSTARKGLSGSITDHGQTSVMTAYASSIAGTSARRKCPSRTPADRMPQARDSTAKIKATAASAVEAKRDIARASIEVGGSIGRIETEADADEAPGRQRHPWILLQGTHRPE